MSSGSSSQDSEETITSSSSSDEMSTDLETTEEDVIVIESSSEEELPPPSKKKKTDGGSKPTLIRQDAVPNLAHKVAAKADEPVEEVTSWPTDLAENTTQARLRNFVFTLNNYSEDEFNRIKAFADSCSYICFGKEVSSTGTKHLQGCCLLLKQTGFNALKKPPYPFRRAHIQKMKGTPEQAATYCKKDGDFFEAGTCPILKKNGGTGRGNQGKRNDILAVVNRIKEGATDRMLLDEHPTETFRFLGNIRKVQSLIRPERTKPLEVILCYGPPGCGKTHWAYAQYPDIFRMPVSKDFWMDNYQQERQVLLDDFNGEVKLTFLLQVLDKYPIQIPIKGAFVWWCPDVIVLTCNTHPCNWYNYDDRKDSYAALKRRVTKVLVFKAPKVDGIKETYLPAVETPPHNYFMFQKVLGKNCQDISENKEDPIVLQKAAVPVRPQDEEDSQGQPIGMVDGWEEDDFELK